VYLNTSIPLMKFVPQFDVLGVMMVHSLILNRGQGESWREKEWECRVVGRSDRLCVKQLLRSKMS